MVYSLAVDFLDSRCTVLYHFAHIEPVRKRPLWRCSAEVSWALTSELSQPNIANREKRTDDDNDGTLIFGDSFSAQWEKVWDVLYCTLKSFSKLQAKNSPNSKGPVVSNQWMESIKGIWWMARENMPKKDVVACDKLRWGGKQPLTRRCPNGETHLG